MNKQKKKIIVKKLLKEIQHDIVGKIANMPDEWGEIELGWIIADRAREFEFRSIVADRKIKFLYDRRTFGI